MMRWGWVMVRRIVIELETPGDSRTMFRLRIDDSTIADDLTAVQAHVLIGEILDRITMPKSPEGAALPPESDAATAHRRSNWPRRVRRRAE
jgi:hypothetical protein